MRPEIGDLVRTSERAYHSPVERAVIRVGPRYFTVQGGRRFDHSAVQGDGSHPEKAGRGRAWSQLAWHDHQVDLAARDIGQDLFRILRGAAIRERRLLPDVEDRAAFRKVLAGQLAEAAGPAVVSFLADLATEARKVWLDDAAKEA